MKKLLFFTFIATILADLSCKNQSILPTEINNSKTDKHINIPGTRLFIIPPNGFKISSTIPGIEKAESGVIQVSDLVGANFYSNSNTVPLNKEDFEKKGVEVFGYNELTVNGFHAKMALVQGFVSDNPTLKSYYLVFGDSSFITMVLGSFFPNDTITDREIKTAMLTTVYNKTKAISPFETAEFMLDDSKSILKFADYTGGVYIYTIDGLNQAFYYPMLIAIPLPAELPKSATERLINTIKDKSLTSVTIKNTLNDTINGFNSYQCEVYGILSGKEWQHLEGKNCLQFFHSVLIEKNVIIMRGVAVQDFEKALEEFKKISNTITKK